MLKTIKSMSRAALLLAMGSWSMGAWALDFETDGFKFSTTGMPNEVIVTGLSAANRAAEVTIPATVSYDGATYNVSGTGEECFRKNTTMKKVTLSEGITMVGDGSFEKSAVETVVLPSTLVSLEEDAFYEAQKLSSINLPEGLVSMGSWSLCGTGLVSIEVPGTVKYLSRLACASNSQLRSITFGEGITELPSLAASNCRKLRTITLPSTLTTIGDEAFKGDMSVTAVISNAKVPPTCGDGVFTGLNFDQAGLVVNSADLAAYQNAAQWDQFKLFYPNVAGNEFTVGDVTYETITPLEVKVKSVSAGITQLKLQNTVTNGVLKYTLVAIGDGAFKGVTSLTSVEIPYSVTLVGTEAFSGCTGLTSLGCGVTVPPVCGADAFKGVNFSTCKLLVPDESIDAYKGAQEWSQFQTIEAGPFVIDSFVIDGLGYDVLTEGTVSVSGRTTDNRHKIITIPATVVFHGVTYNVTEIGVSAFEETDVTNVTLPEGITRLADSSFDTCEDMKSINIPSTLTSMGINVFRYCESLLSIELPDAITVIPDGTFYGCDVINSIKLGDHVTYAAYDSFGHCPELTTLTFPATMQGFGDYAMANNDGMTVLRIDAVNPPASNSSTWINFPFGTCRLVVPAESVEAYKKAEFYKQFTVIKPNNEDTEGLAIAKVNGWAIEKPNEAFTVPFVVNNYDTAEISTITYTLSFQGTVETKELTLPTPLKADPAIDGVLEIPFDAISEEGQYDGTITINKINGNDNGATHVSLNFFVIVTNGTSLPADAVTFANSSEKRYSLLGRMQGAPLWKAAVLINQPAVVGMQIVGMEARGNVEGNSNLCGWISTELSQYPNYTAMTGEQVGGNFKVAFAKPYTVTADGVYVGYTFNATENYPLPYCMPKNIPGSFYATFNDLPFDDYSSEGCAMITVYLTGKVPANSASFMPYDGSLYMVKDNLYALTFPISNGGTNAITSLDYAYTINGKTVDGSADVKIDNTLGALGTFTVEMEPVAKGGYYPMDITLTKVNGEANPSAFNQQSLTLQALDFKAPNYPLMEEGTGTWCGWCPRGWLAMKMMKEQVPDFIGVAWHNNDPMCVAEKFPFPLTAYPQASINRVINEIDPFDGEPAGEFGIYDNYQSFAQQLTPAYIDLVTTWDADKSTLKVDATVTFAGECKGYKMGYVLVGNGYYHPDDGNWFQANYFAGETGYDGALKQLTQMPNPIQDMIFNDVVIEPSMGAGLDNSLPEVAEASKDYTHSVTFNTETINGLINYDYEDANGNEVYQPYNLMEDPENLEVVAFIIAPDGHIVNARKVKAGESVGIEGVGSAPGQPVSSVFYDLSGRRVANPGTGIYIRVDRMANGTTRSSKVLM